MTLPTETTVVTYPAGAVTSAGVVLHVEAAPDDRLAVILDVTACHPVDAAWPDQGADRAVLRVAGTDVDVVDCVVAATDGEVLYLGADVPVRKGTEGWTFLVAHLVEAAAGAPLVEGAEVTVIVDAAYRADLSLGHTACHLASLALNATLAAAWSKEVQADALGNPNFDAIAIESSTIEERGSLDIYRVGKSTRKKGFAPAALTDDIVAVSTAVNELLTAWVSAGGPVIIEADGPGLIDRRYWHSTVDGTAVSIPCGGTHASDLAELGGIQVVLTTSSLDSAVEARMVTRVG